MSNPGTTISRRSDRLFLTGFMGAGKSTVGRLLARRLGLSFTDLDALIVAREGRSIATIFAVEGEPRFREIESELLRKIAFSPQGGVIATGGGAVMDPRNRETMRKGGVTVYLSLPFELLWERISSDSSRPLAQQGEESTRELFLSRLEAYRDADLVIECDGKSPLEIVDEIISSRP